MQRLNRNICLKRYFSMVLLPLFSACLLLSSCSTYQPADDTELLLLEKQIAEINQKLDELNHQVSVMQYMVDNHERNLTSSKRVSTKIQKPLAKPKYKPKAPIADKNGVLTAVVPGTSPIKPKGTTADELYHKAMTAYQKSQYDQALSMFKSFNGQYPRHNLADNALYWTGECQYAKKIYPDAIQTFEKVLSQYPNSSKAPDAMLKIGYANLTVGNMDQGKAYLKKVVRLFPFSTAGSKAEIKLQSLTQ